ncbi:2-C-methyl-D-erythritol 2,4-cyclodiphosphate synthase [Tistlia consotensis]|uniref:Bifunctional enzyme IspD/IspF n=1 Tax=Tistlia consotensis USBA 355 TaxID=560819 RepID=A0A1Y6BRN1_9PROT|nr:bifunctional 2-C-methyl-D-erythritol 4-phosphate cytidylyltransferase/2-C-methyl-D-erythritol 2,4-cyclodiphosphate synthase [Tistlia consotensis]SMF25345.1 2-C-methyl-D-erythritol 2,4-cyclodiphosphate synthase [Tistlia consotensis USBA 355]SNR59508.1 2-C-methyl-D-erythritol 2,4-cyclodiphosphate synthase [Tistlia consotensis]
MIETVALVVAAGRGHRFGGALPKQYRRLAGRPLLAHCLERLAAHPGIDAVRVVIHPDDRALYDEAAADLALLEPCAGGAERQDSVRLGLDSLAALPGGAPRRVLIHDGARPFPGAAMLERLLQALDSHDGAIPALAVTDTLKRGRAGPAGMPLCGETVPRDGLWRAQTPQAFRLEAIRAAHHALKGEALTDDAALAERAGLAVALVEGEEENFKVTTQQDLARAERLLAGGGASGRETRIGNGFDVHRFGPGDSVMLCGVPVAHSHGLVGHSDADVGLHALTDALLGALGAGDIGQHFPPTDPRWKGADSAAFLAHAGSLLAARGGRILNLDVTLICERPKVGPHREAMRARIAGILGIAVERVGVKATTTEGLGFTGRREGIAAQATAALELPAAGPDGSA